VGQVEAVSGAKRVPVRQVHHYWQTSEAVPATDLAQSADLAQERGHDAAEPRDDPATHGRNG